MFGFIVMKSGPRRWLNTSLLRFLYVYSDERWGTENTWVELEQAGLV